MRKNNCLKKTVLSLCLLAICWLPVMSQNPSTRGDVNTDTIVNISDVVALINSLLTNNMDAIDQGAADVTRDSQVNITDVVALINYVMTEEWPDEVKVETFTVNGVTFNMVCVKGGTFMMGATDEDSYARPWEKPAHQVTLSDYYIGEFEVTQALWKAVMNNNPSWFTSSNGYGTDLNRPVERVTYSNCKTFINKLNQLTGKIFRLPTEAEWEYAARGGSKSNGYLFSGSDEVSEVAWYKGAADDMTHPVGSKAPNELGLYDMSGNVEEWINDWYDLYTDEPQTNPQGPSTGSYRITRGGSWDQAFRTCRVTYRYDALTTANSSHIGLRIALTL